MKQAHSGKDHKTEIAPERLGSGAIFRFLMQSVLGTDNP